MTHHVATSSFIQSIAHEGDVLTVTLKTGVPYRFRGVDAQTFERMRAADSIGKYFTTHIKPHYALIDEDR